MKIINNDNYIIKCGQNKNENHQLVKDSDGDSLWFHLDKMSSPHVVMSKTNPDYDYTKNDYIEGANLCKMNSKAKNLRSYVIMTKINKLKLTDKIGEVDIRGKVTKFLV